MAWKTAYPSDQAKRTKWAKDKLVPAMEKRYKTKVPIKVILDAAADAGSQDELITMIEKKFKEASKKDLTSIFKECGF